MRCSVFVVLLAFPHLVLAAGSQVELDASRDKAAAWLVRSQQGDGRWVSSAAGLDVQVTATATEALIRSGYGKLPSVAAAVAWLQNAEAGSIDALARQIKTLSMAGALGSAQRLADRLTKEQDPSSAMWGAYPGYSASIPDTPLALLGLRGAGVAIDRLGVIGSAIATARQTEPDLSSGAWWSHNLGESMTLTRSIPGVVPTAYAVDALHAHGLAPTAVEEGVRFMRAIQVKVGSNSGVFVGGSGDATIWESALAADVIATISSQGGADPDVQLTLDLLKRTQSANGSWGGDVFSTAHALMLIGRNGSPISDTDGDGVADALERLLGTDAAIADRRSIMIGRPSDDAVYFSFGALRSRPLTEVLPLGSISACCTALSGSLPSGLTLTASGNPLRAVLGGAPAAEGYFDLQFAYKDAAGTSRRAHVGVEVINRMFRIDADPFPLSVLFTQPTISRLSGGLQFLVEDFNSDGRPDLFGFLNGYRERASVTACNPCSPYSGPDWGLIIGLQGIGSSFAYVNGLAASTQISGDIRSMHVIDFNNDGRMDVLLSLERITTNSVDPADLSGQSFRSVVLLRNDSARGGSLRFTDVTQAVGIDSLPHGHVVITDGNLDGYPDLVVSNGDYPAKYFQYDPSTTRYVDRTVGSGLGVLGMVVGLSYELDLWRTRIDLATLSSSHGLRFYRNNGNGTFTLLENATPLTTLIGRQINRMAVADLNGDLLPELVLFETVRTGGAESAPAGTSVTVLGHYGMQSGLPRYTPWAASALNTHSGSPLESNLGGTVADIDANGRPDIVVASRDVSSQEVSNVIFRQTDAGAFDRLGVQTGFPSGVAAFDSPVAYDLDGDAALDLVFPNSSLTGYRLTNEGVSGHSLTLQLVGKSTNRMALGARVFVTAAGVMQGKQVLANHGNAAQMHFGIGSADEAVVEVIWPDGTLQTIHITHVDRLVTVAQP